MKILKALFLSLMIMTITLHSRPSQAAVGALAAAPAAVTAGLYIIGTGGAIGAAGLIVETAQDAGGWAAFFFVILIALPVAALGLIVLEGEQSMNFAPLDAQAAKTLGVTSSELSAYNTELDQLNALAEYVDMEVIKDGEPTANKAAAIWNDVKDAVSPQAFSALVKVNSQLYNHK